ncbi:MAG: fibronectin type III domain-containing protein [Spirosomataceae bacterium]
MYTVKKKSSLICILFLLFLSSLQLVEAQTIPSAQFANAVRTLYPTLVDANSNTFTAAAASYSGVLDLSGWGNSTKSDGTASAFSGQTKLTNIEGIGYLAQLRGLDASNQALNTIPIVANSVLFIQATNNQLTSLPSTLPTSLEYLRISHNKVTQLPELPTNLKALKCDNNLLNSLPNLPSNLAYLDVSFNKELACLGIIPHNLIPNPLPTTTLSNYVFSPNPSVKLDFSQTGIRCVNNWFADIWGGNKVVPTTPGQCSETPTQLMSTVMGTDAGTNSGTIRVNARMTSAQATIEYRLNNGNYTLDDLFTGVSAGTYTVEARRKSESIACLNPSSSWSVTVPNKTNKTVQVSPLGNDETGNGTIGSPYKTIGKALTQTTSGSGDIINLAEGVYIESQVLRVPSGVSIIGSGSKTTQILVHIFYDSLDYPTEACGDPMYCNYNDYAPYMLIQLQGGFTTLKGFSLSGQDKKCLGGIIGSFASNCIFEDLKLQDFRFTGMLLVRANDTRITSCYIKNSTYGTYYFDRALLFLGGKNLLVNKNTLILNDNIGGYGIKYDGGGPPVQFFMTYDLWREDEYALNIKVEDNTIILNEIGMWNRKIAPAFVFENWADCKNCIFRGNYITNMFSFIDGGPHSNGSFYDGPRYTIYDNTFSLYGYGHIAEANAPNTEFHHNYFMGGSGGINATDNDTRRRKYLRGLNIHHNVFSRTRNIVSWNPANPYTTIKFNNNTVDLDSDLALGTNYLGDTDPEIKNNLFVARPGTNIANNMSWLGTHDKINTNLFYGLSPYGLNSITANPQFLEAGLKPHTFYQLKEGSPAIDKGLLIPGITDGYKGKAPDLGAYESDFNGTSTRGTLSVGSGRLENSAALDLLSNSQGLLVPRMNLAIIQSIPSPPEGLLVFCTDCTPACFYFSNGSTWQKQVAGTSLGTINTEANVDRTMLSIGTATPNPSAIIDLTSSNKGLLLPRIDSLAQIEKPTEGLLVYLKKVSLKGIYFYNGNAWQKAFKAETAFPIVNGGTFNLSTEGSVGTNSTHPAVLMEVHSGNKGILLPRLNKSQMEGVKSPALGLIVYCMDCPMKGFYYNNGTTWQNTVVTPPSPPQNVKATPNGTSASVSFTAPLSNGGSPITSYTVTRKPGNIAVTTTSTIASFSGLLLNVPYIFVVSANNSEGTSELATSNPIIAGVPSPPENAFAFRANAAGSVEVNFTPPAHTGGSPITNYTMTVMPENIAYTAQQSPFVVTGLAVNATHTFSIKANNMYGSSLPVVSNAVKTGGEIASTPKVLDAIATVPRVAYSLRKLRTAYNGPAIEVRRESDNQTISVGFDNEGNLNSGLIQNFCGTSRGFVAVWYDQSGENNHLSNNINSDQPLIYNGLSLEAASGRTAVLFSGSSIFLRTSQTVLTNADELTTLTVAYAGYYSDIFGHGNMSGKGHLMVRRSFGNYSYVLNNANLEESAFGYGGTPSELRTLTSRNTLSENRRHLRVNGNNSVSVNSSIAVGFSNDRLTIGQSFTGHISEHIEYNSYLPLSAIELIENSQGGYFGIAQPCLANSTPPSPPTQVFATNTNATAASISFIPGSSGSRPINYYEVISSPGNIRATSSGSPITVNGLTAGQTYQFSVSAVNFCDEKSIAATSNSLVSGQISAPSNITAQKGIAEGSALVSFNAPTFTNGQPITGYTVTSFPDNLTATANSTSITLTGLSDSKKYSFQVVAHTSSSTSLPSLVSTSIYAHTQIIADLPAPNTAFALRKLRSAYSGPAVQVRRSSDNTSQDIGFLPNGELNEAALLAFVGEGNGFVSVWYDQSGNNRNLTQTNWPEQPRIVTNGVTSRKNNQPTIHFFASNKLNITGGLETTHAFHSVWHAQGPLGRWGFLVGFYPNVGNGGISFTENNTLLRSNNNWYQNEMIFINGVQTSDFAPLNELKSLTTQSIYHPMPSYATGFRIGQDLDHWGGGFGSISTFMMFTNNLSATERTKLDQREAACFEIALP